MFSEVICVFLLYMYRLIYDVHYLFDESILLYSCSHTYLFAQELQVHISCVS